MTDPLRPDRRKRRTFRPLAVDAKRLAKLLSVGLRTVRTWDAAGKLPTPFRIGARKLWDVSEVKAWMKARAPDRAAWEAIKKAHT